MENSQNKPLGAPGAVSPEHPWNTGLDEHMPPEALETAWLDIRKEWRVLLSSGDCPRQYAHLRWVSNRMGLIYALREYQAAAAALQIARKGNPWLFDSCGEYDPFSDDGRYRGEIAGLPLQDNPDPERTTNPAKEGRLE